MEERESFSVRSETETKLGLIETNLNNCEDELKRTKIKLVNCETEKRDLEDELEILGEKKGIFENLLKQAESDLEHSNKTIEKLEQELREVREIELKDYEIVKGEKTKLEKELQILEKNKDDFEKNAQNIQREFHGVNERFDKENSELKSKLEFVQFELEQLKNECTDLNKKFHESECRREEIERNKVILEDEIIELNLNLSDLNAQVEEREKEIVLFYKEKTKLRERIVELEKTNISMQNVISRNEENQIKLEFEFENRLIQILEELVASDVEANYMQSQLRELNSQFNLFKIETQNQTQNKIETSNFEDIIEALETEVEFLKFTKEEVEILNLIFKSKLEEQDDIISKLKESKNELGNLRVHQRELTRRLSEQTLKTEEYKNLSFHFKEKMEDLNNNQAIEKRETESLRMVFIKEQYESKIQEMKSQLLLSNKYSEEMLLKLQNALDEVETSKKNEICLIKKVEEISVSLSDLEREIKGLKIDKRELISELDNLKTELECSSLSFDCLKEEKTKLEICFQECNEERRKLKVEVDLVKRLMENMALNGDLQLNNNNNGSSIGDILETGVNENSIVSSPIKDRSLEKSEGELNGEQAIKDEHFEKNQNLKIALSLFQKELEKLKNENISYIIPQDGDQMDPSLHGLERALSQLDSANEHLGSIFPSFKALSGSGNALERVLALELELVEALQDKKRSDTRFQSSFLKQHNDEDAIFQSFRDINELIQDMLQLKKRNVTTENELREMHGRYSQLSIQFAELEGERQKLMMSLKNRSPRKL